MKNIHTLPTDKPSRLHFTEFFEELVFTPKYEKLDGVNIYITSSNSDINENDYIITKDVKLVQVSYLLSKDLEGASKVILTTDQDLIKDGVQAIDDEFLEWFVKNPSCEEVRIEKWFDKSSDEEYFIPIISKKNFYCGDKFDYDEQCLEQCENCVDKKGVDYGYLPNEEPKQVLTEEDIFNQKDIDAVTDYINIQTSKQETTLEEAAERILANNIDGLRDALKDDDLFFFYKGVVQCYGEAMAKWQQEKTIEEVFEWLTTNNYLTDLKEAFSMGRLNKSIKDFNQRFKNKQDMKKGMIFDLYQG
jgi:lipoate-protein ligase A